VHHLEAVPDSFFTSLCLILLSLQTINNVASIFSSYSTPIPGKSITIIIIIYYSLQEPKNSQCHIYVCC